MRKYVEDPSGKTVGLAVQPAERRTKEECIACEHPVMHWAHGYDGPI